MNQICLSSNCFSVFDEKCSRRLNWKYCESQFCCRLAFFLSILSLSKVNLSGSLIFTYCIYDNLTLFEL